MVPHTDVFLAKTGLGRILIDVHSSQKAECVLHLPSTPTNANANNDSLISFEEDVSPTPLPTPLDFTDELDRDEVFLESGRGCLFGPKLLLVQEMQVHTHN